MRRGQTPGDLAAAKRDSYGFTPIQVAGQSPWRRRLTVQRASIGLLVDSARRHASCLGIRQGHRRQMGTRRAASNDASRRRPVGRLMPSGSTFLLASSSPVAGAFRPKVGRAGSQLRLWPSDLRGASCPLSRGAALDGVPLSGPRGFTAGPIPHQLRAQTPQSTQAQGDIARVSALLPILQGRICRCGTIMLTQATTTS